MKKNIAICVLCNNEAQVSTRNIKKEPICYRCYDKLPTMVCSACSKIRRILDHQGKKEPLCIACSREHA